MPSNNLKSAPEKPVKEKSSHGTGITIFSALILVIIVVTFIGAPVVSKVTESTSMVFGTYDGIPVEYLQGNYFATQVAAINDQYQQYAQGTDTSFLRQLVWRQAFDRTALQIGLKHEAELAGIVVSDAQVDKQLVNHSAYQLNGQFSEQLYNSTSSSDRHKYRSETKDELLIRQYALDHTQGALLSQATKDFIAAMAYPQKKFTFVTFTDADYPANLVADYASKNAGLFRTIDLSRITITSSEGDANKVRDEALKGEKSFSDLAKTYSKDTLAEAGGALGIRHYYELKADGVKAEDLDKIFALTKGGVSAVVKGDKSWTIYKVNTAAADADLTTADTLALARTYLAKNERGLVEDNLEAQAKTFADAAATNFDAAAKAAGKTPATTDWIALNFGNHDLFPTLTSEKDTVIKGLASNEEFYKKAFRLEAGQVSAPILASPSVLVVKVAEVKTAAATGDTPVESYAVESSVTSERGEAVQKLILSSPKFKDNFQTEFARVMKE